MESTDSLIVVNIGTKILASLTIFGGIVSIVSRPIINPIAYGILLILIGISLFMIKWTGIEKIKKD